MESLLFGLLIAEGEQGRVGGAWLPLLPWLLIGALFYFMLLRPEKEKRQQMDKMQSDLKKNDRVVTIGGIFGTVVQSNQDAEDVTIRIDESNNTRIRVLRSSISRKLDTGSGGDA